MEQRKSLSASGSGVDLFREAIGTMPQNEYESWVAVHRTRAIHNSYNYFLAWHRAYLYFFEKRLQELVPSVTIPYWDWARLPEIPGDFRGSGNPLSHVRNPGVIVPTLPSLQSIEGSNGLLTVRTYRSFASQLENAPHNRVHNWVGADMANVSVSPRDPLFWCHHAHVDHLWDRWQRSHTFDGPADPRVQLNVGSGRVITVREVLRITDLQYEYMSATINLKLAEKAAPADVAKPWHLILSVVPESSAFAHAELRLEGIPQPNHQPYEIRVFSGQPDATADTPTDGNPYFIGYFDAVVMGHHHEHGRGVAGDDTMEVSFEVTVPFRSAIERAAEGKTFGAAGGLTFTLVPIGDAREFRFKQASVVLQD